MSLTARQFQLKTPTGVVYDDTAAFKLKAGVYHRFEIQTNLANLSTIKKVTLDIDGTPITISTGTQLEVVQKFLGKDGKQGRLILDLSKFQYRSPRGIYKTALAIGSGEDATLNIEFGTRNTKNSSKQDPESLTMKGKAWMSDNPSKSLPLGGRRFSPVRKTVTLDSADAGQLDWDFPNGSGTKVQSILFDISNVDISQIIVKRGKTEIAKMEKDDINFALKDLGGLVPQDGYLLLDFTLMGFGEADAMNGNGLNFEIMTDGNGAIKTYIEGYEAA